MKVSANWAEIRMLCLLIATLLRNEMNSRKDEVTDPFHDINLSKKIGKLTVSFHIYQNMRRKIIVSYIKAMQTLHKFKLKKSRRYIPKIKSFPL